jgi:CheY-like chemotaxis protein
MKGPVLVIEDDPGMADYLAFVLEEQGFTVLRAPDGPEGIDLALQHRPPVVVCDLLMGRMHGFEVLERLRPELRGSVFVVVSSKAYKPDMDRARALGADAYLVKPVTPEELLGAIEGGRPPAAGSPPLG